MRVSTPSICKRAAAVNPAWPAPEDCKWWFDEQAKRQHTNNQYCRLFALEIDGRSSPLLPVLSVRFPTMLHTFGSSMVSSFFMALDVTQCRKEGEDFPLSVFLG